MPRSTRPPSMFRFWLDAQFIQHPQLGCFTFLLVLGLIYALRHFIFALLLALVALVIFAFALEQRGTKRFLMIVISIGMAINAVFVLFPKQNSETLGTSSSPSNLSSSETSNSSTDVNTTNTESVPTSSYPWRFIRTDTEYGCVDKETTNSLIGIAVQGDREAYSKALTLAFGAGACRAFQKNQEVYIEGGNLLGGLVEVRIKGETQKWWTNMESTSPSPVE